MIQKREGKTGASSAYERSEQAIGCPEQELGLDGSTASCSVTRGEMTQDRYRYRELGTYGSSLTASIFPVKIHQVMIWNAAERRKYDIINQENENNGTGKSSIIAGKLRTYLRLVVKI